MKKIIFTLLLSIALKLSAQVSFIGFDQPICGSSISVTYTYSNYSSGWGSGTIYGFKVYRNGIEVYDVSGNMGGGQICKDLIFINDSTGFVVGQTGFGAYVIKTSDYGNSWTNIGSGSSGYFGLYVINANFAYLVTVPNTYQSFVIRCSDIESPTTFISDYNLNADIYKTDTVLGSSLCNIDSLNILILNDSGDTIDYHINLHSIPLAVNELFAAQNPFIVFPIPAEKEINIEGAVFEKVEIYDVRGIKIRESCSRTINIELLPKGVYFVNIVESNDKTTKLKIIKN